MTSKADSTRDCSNPTTQCEESFLAEMIHREVSRYMHENQASIPILPKNPLRSSASAYGVPSEST